ncbi:hypothetical protein DV736_g3101, partial [Chaetothyriales sp. CBS 134916]
MSTSNYIDIDSLTSDEFSAYDHAATLIQRSNNPADPIIDLNAPLSRALFDLQEIDSHIHTLTSHSALDILRYNRTQSEAAQRILNKVEEERDRLNASYARLQQEVLGRYERASTVKLNAIRSWEVLQLGRQVQRVLTLGRQFETAIADSGLGASRVGKEDHQALVRATRLILAFRDLMAGAQGPEVGRVDLIKTIRGRIFEDGEARVLDFARRTVREFAMSSLAGPTVSNGTFKDVEGNSARFTSACHILYLLSPAPRIDGAKMVEADFEPEYLLRALQSYLQSAITSSSAAIGRALAQLPLLERTMVEEILNRGGVSARTLRSQKEAVRQEIKQCVMQGSKTPQIMADGSTGATEEATNSWEREAAVMVGSVMAPLGR